jgi:hypothetical protein
VDEAATHVTVPHAGAPVELEQQAAEDLEETTTAVQQGGIATVLALVRGLVPDLEAIHRGQEARQNREADHRTVVGPLVDLDVEAVGITPRLP